MAGYIYNLIRTTATGQVEFLDSSTKKWVITEFVSRNFISQGLSIAALTVVRSLDGRPSSAIHLDPYEFMNLDMGEE